jgi:hypothetical protein
MKKLLWFLVVLAAVSLIFTGCPIEPDDENPPPTELGDGGLRLTGVIYEVEESTDPDGYPVVSYFRTAKGGTVYTTVNGERVTASVTYGAFDITIPKPTDSSLDSTIYAEVDDFWDDIVVSDPTAKSMLITDLETAGEIGTGSVWKGKNQVDTTALTLTTEMAGYLYTDKEVTVSAPLKTWTAYEDPDDPSYPSAWSAEGFSLRLAQGWNVLCVKITIVMSQEEADITVELSKNNPDLPWLYEDEDED